MKNLIFLVLLAPTIKLCAQYKPAVDKSSIHFTIKNFGIPVSGDFTNPEGTIVFDPAHPELAAFRVSVKSATVNTGNELRDSHLKEQDYFDAEHFPVISFVSSRVINGKDGMILAYGMLTIKSQSREIVIPFKADVTGDGYLFKGQFSINRHDFYVGGSSIIGDNAVVTLSVQAIKQ